MQSTGNLFTYSVVVADNDKDQSASALIEEMAPHVAVSLKYCVEPRQNIARTRNKAVENCSGDFVAFIDDDEFPPADWLLTLFKTICQYDTDGVLAPVNPHFDEGAPLWVIQGGFYNRPVHPTGMVLSWTQCRTGNVLLRRDIFEGSKEPFNPECLSGEDQDFFRRKIEEGHKFIWCHEAAVSEVVPPIRWSRSFLVRRALFRGVFAQKNHGLQPMRILQAMISAPMYVLALPVAFVFGQDKFMTCIFKLSYHMGRLFALFGFNPIRQPYVTE